MRERFMEDEDELPYLVSEKRDDIYPKSSSQPKKTLNQALNSLYISDHEKRVLKNKLEEFLNASGCVGLKVADDFDGVDFIITRKNRYVTTTHTFEYLVGANQPRIFMECYTSHDYTGLLNDPEFKRLINSTGFEFIDCYGGFVCDYSGRVDEFFLRDELDLRVTFRVGSEKRMYNLDLEKMKLAEKYFEY